VEFEVPKSIPPLTGRMVVPEKVESAAEAE
jgi:hypothetical protein